MANWGSVGAGLFQGHNARIQNDQRQQQIDLQRQEMMLRAMQRTGGAGQHANTPRGMGGDGRPVVQMPREDPNEARSRRLREDELYRQSLRDTERRERQEDRLEFERQEDWRTGRQRQGHEDAWSDAERSQRFTAANIQNESARATLDEYLRITNDAKSAKKRRDEMMKSGIAGVMLSAMESGNGFADPSAIRFFNNQNRDSGMQIDTSLGAYFDNDGQFIYNLATENGPQPTLFNKDMVETVKQYWRDTYGIKPDKAQLTSDYNSDRLALEREKMQAGKEKAEASATAARIKTVEDNIRKASLDIGKASPGERVKLQNRIDVWQEELDELKKGNASDAKGDPVKTQGPPGGELTMDQYRAMLSKGK